MVEKMMKPDFLNKAISLLIAIGLWFFVAYSENPQTELWFSGIQINYLNENSLADKDLVRIKDNTNHTVAVKVRGNRSAILSLTAADIVATVDLSTVKKATDNVLPVSVKFPIDGLTTVDKKPYNIAVKIENIISQEFDVVVEKEGNPQDNIIIKNFTSSVEKVTLTGGKSIINNIKECVARVNVEDISSVTSEQALIEVRNKDGEIVKGEDIEFSNTYTKVDVDVDIVKEVPVKPVFTNLKEGEAEKIKLSDEKIKVYGNEEEIKKIEMIETEAITLAKTEKTENVTLKLMPPENIKIIGNTSAVTAEITFKEDEKSNE